MCSFIRLYPIAILLSLQVLNVRLETVSVEDKLLTEIKEIQVIHLKLWKGGKAKGLI